MASEVSIMKRCTHSNIVQLLEEFETKDSIYLVMELVKVSDGRRNGNSDYENTNNNNNTPNKATFIVQFK